MEKEALNLRDGWQEDLKKLVGGYARKSAKNGAEIRRDLLHSSMDVRSRSYLEPDKVQEKLTPVFTGVVNSLCISGKNATLDDMRAVAEEMIKHVNTLRPARSTRSR